MQMINGAMKKDDYETACDIAELLNIDTNNKEKIMAVKILPPKYNGKMSVEHFQNILISRIK